MTEKREKATDQLLLICRRIQKRFGDGYCPTFKQMQDFNSAIEIFDLMLLCGHKVIDECDCGGDEEGI